MTIGRAAAATLLALATLSACKPQAGGAAAGEGAVATDHVDLPRSYLFRPAAITVRAGTRVTWTNHDVFTHAVQMEGEGGSPLLLKPGDSVSVVLAQPGVHRYTCPFHPQMMKGTVTVTGS